MGFIIIAPFCLLAGWSIFAIARWLRTGGYWREWQKRFVILICVGLAVGTWFAFFSRYTMAKVHLEGFPIPVHIESPPKPDEPTATPTPMPLPIKLGAMVTDFLSGIAICLSPIPIALFLKENRKELPKFGPRTDPPS